MKDKLFNLDPEKVDANALEQVASFVLFVSKNITRPGVMLPIGVKDTEDMDNKAKAVAEHFFALAAVKRSEENIDKVERRSNTIQNAKTFANKTITDYFK